MKAWIVENTSDTYLGDDWNEIVFANNFRQAKTKATYTSLFDGDYLNLRVKRYPDMDDTENLNHKDYTYKLWQSGWMWVGAYPLEPYDNYSDKREARQDFLEWYNEYYKGSENNEID